ncbi:uncharacterized protein JCM6883_003331 [Sporobolomyces salmoneus]|uniref:uncharacterized protein n=1 Tax=Sporobolomyces salmoneus TaxID=183962 RepID=UPI00317F071E
MSGWRDRRKAITDAINELIKSDSSPASTSDELLHATILRILELQNSRKELPSHLRTIASNSLSLDDFRSLSILSSSGPFNSVELVIPESSLTGRSVTGGKVFVTKTTDRRWAFRMRQQQSIVNEIAVLRLGLSDHSSPSASPRIPRLIASWLSESTCHLLLSHASGGDLWGILEASIAGKDPAENAGLPEDWVKLWFAQLEDAVEWLHEKGWAHRDIKPHNLLLLSSGHLQLTDFGSAAPLSATSPTSQGKSLSIPRKFALALVGTPDYISPEILQYAELIAEESNDFESSLWRESEDERAYGNEVDWWSCGVVLYELLFGQAPFFAEAIAETYERIVNFQEYLEIPMTASVSEDARDLIAQLLVEADERPTAEEIKSHRWFRGIGSEESIRQNSVLVSPFLHRARQGRVANFPDARFSGTPPYRPPPFEPPAVSPAHSFSHQRQSSASLTTFSNSFFSSPGLSILRPSPSTLEGARKEEPKYWEAVEFGGLTILPPADAFEVGSSPSDRISSPFSSAHPLTSSPSTAAAQSPRVALPFKDMSRFSYETPARPSRSRREDSTGTRGEGGGGTPSSSTRSRRMISDVEAWKEMQEHAWEVGMSAKKQQASARKPLSHQQTSRTSTPSRGEAMGREDSQVRAQKEVTGTEKGGGQDLGSLEARHEEMVKELDEMTKKYGSLFDLVNREGV